MGGHARWAERSGEMDRLAIYIEALRALAMQREGNRLAEQQIDNFVRTEAADPRSSLERLHDAISIEIEQRPSESSFWFAAQGYVDSCLSKYSEGD